MDAEGVRAAWDKYKFAILALAIGAGLMIWPTGRRVVTPSEAAPEDNAPSGEETAAVTPPKEEREKPEKIPYYQKRNVDAPHLDELKFGQSLKKD